MSQLSTGAVSQYKHEVTFNCTYVGSNGNITQDFSTIVVNTYSGNIRRDTETLNMLCNAIITNNSQTTVFWIQKANSILATLEAWLYGSDSLSYKSLQLNSLTDTVTEIS